MTYRNIDIDWDLVGTLLVVIPLGIFGLVGVFAYSWLVGDLIYRWLGG